jgi:uncharacterized protein
MDRFSYTEQMSHEYVASSLDTQSFAKSAASMSGQNPVSDFARLSDELGESALDREIFWQVQGELRDGAAGQAQVWLHLKVQAVFPLICQRCLGPAEVVVAFDRAFRFVSTEAQAEKEDEESEEDVLVLDRTLNLLALIEDELLMALPVIPLHETCPTEVKLKVQDLDFEGPDGKQPNPFAVLDRLRTGKSS